MKIAKDARVRVYELTYLIAANLTADEVTHANQLVLDIVKKNKGKVLATEEWGKKDLAYNLKIAGVQHTQAIYTHLQIEMDAGHVQKLEKDMLLSNQVLRHLLVSASSKEVVEVKPEAEKEKPESETAEIEVKDETEVEKKTDKKEKK